MKKKPSRDPNKAAFNLVQRVIAKSEKREREPFKETEKAKRT